MKHIIVAGAGPAGLMAAAVAARRHAVTLLERLPAPGRRLLATGGRRCNLTHDLGARAFCAAFTDDRAAARFLAPAIHRLPPEALRGWFARRGVPTMVQPDGCVFPVSQRAQDVLAALLEACHAGGVRLRCNATVTRVFPEAGGVVINGVETLHADAVVWACGGRSFTSLGADPENAGRLEAAGVNVTPLHPALAGLVARVEALPPSAPPWRGLAGVTLENACVWQGAAPATARGRRRGAVLFTHRGVSGPAVLDVSGGVASRLCGAHPVVLHIGARAGMDAAAWLAKFAQWRASRGAAALHNLLSGEVPRAWAEWLCSAAGLRGVAPAQAKRGPLARLAGDLAGFPFPVASTEGWQAAMATRGGIALGELDPRTLRCKRFPKFSAAGEAVDLDGPCGGYNLTWAFASGMLAGGPDA